MEDKKKVAIIGDHIDPEAIQKLKDAGFEIVDAPNEYIALDKIERNNKLIEISDSFKEVKYFDKPKSKYHK